jgi:hypothetical protein
MMSLSGRLGGVLLLLSSGVLHAADVCHPQIKAPADAIQAKQQIAQFESLLTIASDRATVQYMIAAEQAHVGAWDAAYRNLDSAIAARPWFDPSGDAAFAPVLECPLVQRALADVHAHHAAVGARLFRTIPPADLIPEGLAVDPASGDFYLSSIFHRKIVRFRAGGPPHDFISSGQDGTLGVLGIRIDPRDGTVWANSEAAGKAWLHHWDRSGKLIARYTLRGGEHLFNDLVVDRKGNVWLTDSADNSLYTLQQGSTTLERIALPHAFYPNGIALSDDEKHLYVSDAFELFRIDIATRAIDRLRPQDGVSIAGFDGLYFYRNSLIGIQNGVGTPRVLQVKLSADGARVLGVRVLEYRSPLVEIPTTGAIYKDQFYFIANSQIDQLQGEKIRYRAKLKPVHIAVVPLPH